MSYLSRKNLSFLTRSLRGRYLVVALLISLFVIALTVTNYAYLNQIKRESTSHIGARNDIAHYSRLIRNHLWDADYHLLSYALAPTETSRTTFIDSMEAALQHARNMASMQWPKNLTNPLLLQNLSKDLSHFQKQGLRLMEVRIDEKQMFPGMNIMVERMYEANRHFYSTVTSAMDEAEKNANEELAHVFEGIRHNWALMVSGFRAYVAQSLSLAGNDHERMEAQAQYVESFYQALLRQMDELEQTHQASHDSLRGAEYINILRQQALLWLESFIQVKYILTSDNWRADIPLLTQTIQPLIQNIRHHLQLIDRQLEAASYGDLTTFKNTANYLSNAQIVVSTIVLLFVVMGYIFLKRLIIKPIERVCRALNEARKGNNPVDLPRDLTHETHELISAFTKMHREVQQRQAELEHQALHDDLTQLPNRNLLQKRLQVAIKLAASKSQSLALIMIDLNRFKEINDTLGHHVGDTVLKVISQRISRVIRASDTCARLGGDEFAILLPEVDEDQATRIAKKILATIQYEMDIDGHHLFTGGSLGIALYPTHGLDAQTLVKRADVAMYMAKHNNIGLTVYDRRQDTHSVARLSLISDLHRAIEQNELEIYYQPKIDVVSGAPIGAEALLRWHHSQRGYLPPEQIISLAEDTGQIKDLTLWVLTEALRESRHWLLAHPDLLLSVNLSVWNLQERDLQKQIESRLDRWNIPAKQLGLEITESAMMADPQRAQEVLCELDAMGITLSVDDYGTGFSSLGYLKKLPVDELKIDKSFVMSMEEDDNDAIIVRSTIDLAHNLGLKVVAEGVETEDALNLLAILGCNTVQGYFTGRPMPAGEFSDWLNHRKPTQSDKIINFEQRA